MTDRHQIELLIRTGYRYRNTPFSDACRIAATEEFTRELRLASDHIGRTRPEVVTLCGSTRFYAAFQEANYRLTMEGKIVLSVGHYPHTEKRRMIVDGCMGQQEVEVMVATQHGESVGCTPEQKVELDRLHFRKIEMSDRVLVLNCGGYVGESTRNEIAHATGLGIPITYLEPMIEDVRRELDEMGIDTAKAKAKVLAAHRVATENKPSPGWITIKVDRAVVDAGYPHGGDGFVVEFWDGKVGDVEDGDHCLYEWSATMKPYADAVVKLSDGATEFLLANGWFATALFRIELV